MTFSNLSISSDELESYQWNFRDGSTLLTTGGATSSMLHPTHVYTQVGSFTVSLTATAGSKSDVEIKTDHIAVSAPVRLELMMRIITYTYDGLHRLTGADYSTGESFAHTYDAVGNRTRMTSTTPLSGTVVTIHTYDAAKRLTSRTMSDGHAYSYVWSARGQLLSEWTQGYPVRTFAYDAAGHMVKATVFTLTTCFAYNGPTDLDYTVFMHLLGPDGQSHGQVDRFPAAGAAPSTRGGLGQVVLDEMSAPVDADAPPGLYHLAVGLYDAASGGRLPISDANGQSFPDDQFVLPLEISVHN